MRSAEQGVRITEDRILLQVAQDYLDVVGGEELAKVAEQTLALAQDRLKQARDFFEAGETTKRRRAARRVGGEGRRAPGHLRPPRPATPPPASCAST